MHLTDPIADMLTRIRNGNMARHTEVKVPFSKIKESMASILKNEGYITGYEIKEEGNIRDIVVTLKYMDGDAVIKGLKRISKPGRRVYTSVENLPKVFNKDESIKILEDSEVLNLPVYGKASAGRGYLNMDKPDYYMPITKGDFSLNSFFVEITGDSMEPTLEDGEYALVDPNNTAYVKNKIYVVTYNDEGYIKRVEVKDKKKVITLKSDNPDYDDIDISEEMQEYFKINGRVVEVISKKRVL